MDKPFRRCAKCGKQAVRNPALTFHKFPNPGKRNQSILKARVWASYCYPMEDWSSYRNLEELYKKGRVMCSEHFDSTSFIDNRKTKLSSFAIPSGTQDLLETLRKDKLEPSLKVKFLHNVPYSVCNDHNYYSEAKIKSKDCNILHTGIQDSDDLILLKEDPRYSEKDDKENDEAALDVSNTGLFSWHKKYEIVPQEDDDCKVLHEDTQDSVDFVMLEEDRPHFQKTDNQNNDITKETETDGMLERQEHDGFQCNCCRKAIVGYRYCCVQCEDYDLCGACEARGAHPLHYVLRVPGPRPYEEVQSMLQLIRRQLFRSDVYLTSGDKSTSFIEDGIKLETKEEVEEVDPFETTTQPASVSSLVDQVEETENTGQEAVNETDAESIQDLISENITSKLGSMDNQTSMLASKDEEFTADLVPDALSSNFILTVQQTDCEDSRTDITSKTNPIKLILSQEPTSNNCDEESTTYLPTNNILYQPTKLHQSTLYPNSFRYRRKTQHFTSKNSYK